MSAHDFDKPRPEITVDLRPPVEEAPPLQTGFGLSRRSFLLGAAGLFLAPKALARTSPQQRKIRDVEVTSQGVTVTMDLENAPFPHKTAGYRDSTVIAYIPKYFRVKRDQRVDMLVHFHGYRDTAAQAMKRHQLREQLFESKQNAIILFPQGPVRTNDMAGGKLEEKNGLLNLLSEVREVLQVPSLQARLDKSGIPSQARVGKAILSCHSGGFRVASFCLERGGWNVNEVYLFDALYGRTNVFRDWVKETYHRKTMAERHKLVSYYADAGPTLESKRLMSFFDRDGIAYMHERMEGAELSKRDITKARAVFIATQTHHDRVMYSTKALRDCLFASCLTRHVRADWFKDQDKPGRAAPKEEPKKRR